MHPIKNQSDLPRVLSEINTEWQREIFDRLGVVVVPLRSSVYLLSRCGYIDLDADAEYIYNREKELTEYITIHSVEDLVKYIQQMPSYHEFLVDESLGSFSKSELLWAVFNQIILVKENQLRMDGTSYQDWGLYKICADQAGITLDMALVDYDATQIWIPRKREMSLAEALELIAEDLNNLTDDIEDIPIYRVFHSVPFSVPSSMHDVLELLQPGKPFGWLTQ